MSVKSISTEQGALEKIYKQTGNNRRSKHIVIIHIPVQDKFQQNPNANLCFTSTLTLALNISAELWKRNEWIVDNFDLQERFFHEFINSLRHYTCNIMGQSNK